MAAPAMPGEVRSGLPRAEVYALLMDYPEFFLICRAYNHAWGRPANGYVNGQDKTTGREYLDKPTTCDRCGTTRHDRLTYQNGRWREDLDVGGGRYTWPEGYLFPYGIEISSIEIREFFAWQELQDRKSRSARRHEAS